LIRWNLVLIPKHGYNPLSLQHPGRYSVRTVTVSSCPQTRMPFLPRLGPRVWGTRATRYAHSDNLNVGFAGTLRDGSDDTRTRDLRGDRPARCVSRPCTAKWLICREHDPRIQPRTATDSHGWHPRETRKVAAPARPYPSSPSPGTPFAPREKVATARVGSSAAERRPACRSRRGRLRGGRAARCRPANRARSGPPRDRPRRSRRSRTPLLCARRGP
jgi:hypothetical protein